MRRAYGEPEESLRFPRFFLFSLQFSNFLRKLHDRTRITSAVIGRGVLDSRDSRSSVTASPPRPWIDRTRSCSPLSCIILFYLFYIMFYGVDNDE